MTVRHHNQTKNTTTLVFGTLAGLVVVLLLAGCAPDKTVPWFTTPIAWGKGYRVTVRKPADIKYVPTTVELTDRTHAQLTSFPQGRTRKDSKGYLCLDVSTQSRYSGKATWSNLNVRTIVLKFPGSSVSVSADSSGLGDQDWTSLMFNECGTGANWGLSLECGIPGYGGPGKKEIPSEEPCRK